MTTSAFFPTLRGLIARDELPAALGMLRELLAHSPKLDEAIHQAGRFEQVRQQIRLGTVSQSEAALAQNQIRAALLDFVRELEAQGETPPHRAEMERAISIVKSKNAVVGSTISAKGDLHVGDKITVQSSAATPKSGWIKTGAAIVLAISILAGIAQISGYSLKELFDPKEEPPAQVVQPPAVQADKDTAQLVEPTEAATPRQLEPKPATPKKTEPKNHFEANGQSQQINVPDNQGTININQ